MTMCRSDGVPRPGMIDNMGTACAPLDGRTVLLDLAPVPPLSACSPSETWDGAHPAGTYIGGSVSHDLYMYKPTKHNICEEGLWKPHND